MFAARSNLLRTIRRKIATLTPVRSGQRLAQSVLAPAADSHTRSSHHFRKGPKHNDAAFHPAVRGARAARPAARWDDSTGGVEKDILTASGSQPPSVMSSHAGNLPLPQPETP